MPGGRHDGMSNLRFNDKADAYTQTAFVQKELAEWTLEWLADGSLPHSATVLELGAGTGLLTRGLVDLFAAVTATDEAQAMIAHGRSRVPAATWQPLDAWQPAAFKAKVDLITSSGLLQWCPDPCAAFHRWRDTLHPGGKMVHGFFAAPTLPEWQEAAPGMSPVQWHPPEYWQAWAREAGFADVSIESRSWRIAFANARTLLRFIHRTGATSTAHRATPGALRKALQAYDKRWCDPHTGQVHATWTFCRLSAANLITPD